MKLHFRGPSINWWSRLSSILFILIIITACVVTDTTYASFKGKNGLIAFESTRGSPGFEDVYLMNPDGTNQVNLTNSPTVRDLLAKWSPDGKKILFSSNRSGHFEVYVMDANGANVVQLTSSTSSANFLGNWSPDGKKIAFISNRDSATRELFIMNADGTNIQQLTFPGLGQRVNNIPHFSKDGKKILFQLTDIIGTVSSSIYSINADGTNFRPVTDPSEAAAEEYMGDLSPNDAQIAFLDFAISALSNVYVSKLKNNAGNFVPILLANSQKITMDGNNNAIVFSPDTKYLLIAREPGVTVDTVTFNNDIYVVKFNEKGPYVLTNLTNGNGAYANARPDWQPIKDDD